MKICVLGKHSSGCNIFVSITLLFIWGILFKFSVFAVNLPEYIIDIGNMVCPILNHQIHNDTMAIYNGKVYHFCCENCVKIFFEKPNEYITKLADVDSSKFKNRKLKVTNNQGKCPITGEDINVNYFIISDDNITFYSSNESKQKAIEILHKQIIQNSSNNNCKDDNIRCNSYDKNACSECGECYE